MQGKDLEYFAVNVRDTMHSRDMTREQLAEKIGSEAIFVRDILNCHRTPNDEVALAIAEALDVSIDELVSKPKKPPYTKIEVTGNQ